MMDSEVLDFDIGVGVSSGGDVDDDAIDIEHHTLEEDDMLDSPIMPSADASNYIPDLLDLEPYDGLDLSPKKLPRLSTTPMRVALALVPASVPCDVAVVALQEAAKTVSVAMKKEVRRTLANGHFKNSSATDEKQMSCNKDCQQKVPTRPEPEDEMDKKINQLRNELELANRKCEAYRTNLLSVLKEMEDQKLQVSIKVQNIKISLKDNL